MGTYVLFYELQSLRMVRLIQTRKCRKAEMIKTPAKKLMKTVVIEHRPFSTDCFISPIKTIIINSE